ncbi:HAD-IC family P-type ATPase [Brachybacterium sp. GPGPB12]|uniref:HAD-IC family P-type ATPase n=1 Tax=Brachybacterium sp. GPGPB12 TaxID=3023517 RepID=UPI0031344028
MLVKNGAKVPVDGTVLAGTGAIDEAAITGESIPAAKGEDDPVFAGGVSAGGFLQVRATGVGADTTLARIIHRVEEAQDAKARTQTFLERFSTWYTPGIILLALLAGLATGDVVLALTLLVIGRPGALVISIPVAVVAGIGRGARDGLLIKGGEFLETSAEVDTVALDKTGTLTEGRPYLTDVTVLDPALDRTAVFALGGTGRGRVRAPAGPPGARGRGRGGHRPRRPARAHRAGARQGHRRRGRGQARRCREPAAAGARGRPRPRRGAGGDRAPGRARPHPDGRRARRHRDRRARGRGPARPEAAEMVRHLHAEGVRGVLMLTGDDRRVAEAVAAQVGIDEVRAGPLPEDKLAAVTALRSARDARSRWSATA